MHRLRTLRALIVFLTLLTARAALAQDLVTLVKRIQPAVVTLTAYDSANNPLRSGSGFFINQGLLVTNRHVLDGASRAEVKTADGKTYAVRLLVAEDKDGDLVEVKTDIPQALVHALPLSNALPEAGERVVVIGSPLGLEQTVSDGLVSAVRDFPDVGTVVQITAPVSPGSSGSPVVNMKGEVIGVATLMGTQGQALNFAVPARRVAALRPEQGRTLAQWTSWETVVAQLLTPITPEEGEELRASEVEDLLKEASKATDPVKALPLFKKAVQLQPDCVRAWRGIGKAYYLLGRYREAIAAFKQVLSLQPNDGVAYDSLGNIYVRIGQPQLALEMYQQAARLADEKLKMHYGEKTEKTGTEVTALAYARLGSEYNEMWRYQEALAPLEQAIRLHPYPGAAYYNLGVVYEMLGRPHDAVRAYQKVLVHEPNDPFSRCYLGQVYVELGDLDAAWKEYKVLRTIPHGEPFAKGLFDKMYPSVEGAR